MKTKLLFVTPFFAPAWAYGGPPIVLYELAQALRQHGVEVACITTNALSQHETVRERVADLNGIRTCYFPNLSNRLAWSFKFFTPIGMNRFLQNHINEFDIVHIADFRNLCTYWAWKHCLRTSKPFVLSPFGSLPIPNDWKVPIKKMFDTTFCAQALRDAYAITVQTDHERKVASLLGAPNHKIKLIPLHINTEKFAVLPSKGHFRKKHGLQDEDRLILFVGRIHQHKIDESLIDCFRQVRSQECRAKLVIIGRNDGYELQLRQYVARNGLNDHVVFAGPVYHPDNLEAYVDANLFVMAPTHYEETSTASLEALACGCPVVTTLEAEIPFLEMFNAGRIVANRKDLPSVILNLLTQPPSPDTCKELIKQKFLIQHVVKLFLNDVYPTRT